MKAHARFLLLIAFVALAHAGVFIVYQRPDWETRWNDQGGYHLLGKALAEHGRYTRFPTFSPFVPEGIRTPGYPVFVAAVYRLFGIHHIGVALSQAVVFAATCVLVYALGVIIAELQVARAAGLATALYPPIPYYGALILSEVWTTFLLTAAITLLVLTLKRTSLTLYAAAGLCLGLTALSRPAFSLLPFFLAAVLILFGTRYHERGLRFGGTALIVGVAIITFLPWFAYNYVFFHRITLIGVVGISRPLWEGYWNTKLPGRLGADITRLAENPRLSDEDLRVAVRRLTDNPEALRYARQWRSIHMTGPNPRDPIENAAKRLADERSYWHQALDNIRQDLPGYVARRLTYGILILWIGEIPIRYSQINQVPRLLLYTIWAAQAALLAAGLTGFLLLLRADRRDLAFLLATPLVYVTIVHLPLLAEARQSLPTKPIMLVLFSVTFWHLRRAVTSPESGGS